MLIYACFSLASAPYPIPVIFNVSSPALPALTSSVASVCNPGDVGCLDSYGFPSLDGLHHRASLSAHDPEALGFSPNGAAEPDCLNLLDAGFYRSELGQLGAEAREHPPPKRLKMSLAEPFNEAAVGSHHLGLDYQATRSHHITGAKMAVSVTDFASLAAGEAPSYMGAHTHVLHQHQHQQHTALQSE